MSSDGVSADAKPRRAGAFDIRRIIALLMGVYGLVITVMGIWFTSEQDLRQAAGVNVNLWSGIGMLLFAGLFLLWAWWRPIEVTEPESDDQQARGTAQQE